MAKLPNELAFRQELKDQMGKIDVIVRAPNYLRRAIDPITVQSGAPIS